MAGPLQTIEAVGSHYEIGLEIGRQTREQIHVLAGTLRRTADDGPDAADALARYMAHVEQYPFILDELRGLADGAGLPFDALARIQVVELERPRPEPDACSTFVVKNEERLLIGHNEDGRREDDVFVLRAAYPSGLSVLALCYVGSLPGHAPFVNSHGVVSACNALTCADARIGEPKRVFCRRVLDARSIDDGVELLAAAHRAQGEHFLLVRGDRTVSIETSATAMSVRKVETNDYHCNNYLHPPMLRHEAAPESSNTFGRSARAQEVCGELHTLDDVRAALSSHERGFCRHRDGRTLACVLFDCTGKRILIGHGPPCEARMQEFTVDWEW